MLVAPFVARFSFRKVKVEEDERSPLLPEVNPGFELHAGFVLLFGVCGGHALRLSLTSNPELISGVLGAPVNKRFQCSSWGVGRGDEILSSVLRQGGAHLEHLH